MGRYWTETLHGRQKKDIILTAYIIAERIISFSFACSVGEIIFLLLLPVVTHVEIFYNKYSHNLRVYNEFIFMGSATLGEV